MTPADRIRTQYLRLLKAYGGIVTPVSISDIADALYCSPGHARVLLQEMRDKGWVSWISRSGRGAKGQLQCLYPEKKLLLSTSDNVVSEETDYAQIITNADQQPVTLEVLFYRPIASLTPSLFSGRFERHHFRMIHSGLLRYLPDSDEPKADLAHYWQASEDNLSWKFHLREGVKWHNGERVFAPQILTQLQRLVNRNDLKGIFLHVISVNLTGAWCIEFNLSRADPLLAHRLANPACALPHPEQSDIGMGPFYIAKHSPKEFSIRRWDYYHNSKPLINEVHYKTAPGKDFSWTTFNVNCAGTVNSKSVQYIQPSNSFSFMIFNHREGVLSELQQKFLRIFVWQTVKSIISPTLGMSVPDEKWTAFRCEKWEGDEIILPSKIKLGYFYTPHTELLVTLLVKKLRYFKCELEVTPVLPRNYLSKDSFADLSVFIGDFIPGENLAVSMEGIFRSSPIATEFLSESISVRGLRLLNIASSHLSKERYERKILSFARWILKQHIITPLFSHEFALFISENARGVSISTQGLPDYRSIWFE